MASQGHLASSNFVKYVHKKLREDSKTYGVEETWRKHCADDETMKEYATAMHNLASNYWENNFNKNSKDLSRIEWIYNFSQYYFSEKHFYDYRQKEVAIADKINIKITDEPFIQKNRYELLDVGSCYNPFQKYFCFNVLPIDIAPATSDVKKCDFLNLKVSSTSCSANDTEICELQFESFDIVVFSLLLEYLPSPDQRLLACEKAYEVLKPEGILFIITPDSNHVGANAKIMKSWRYLLAKIGFSRIKYEKLPYLHCMVFRKCLNVEISRRWADLQNDQNFYHAIVIPQDFQKIEKKMSEDGTECDVTLFTELPNFCQ